MAGSPSARWATWTPRKGFWAGYTAAHCGRPGSRVEVKTVGGYREVGTFLPSRQYEVEWHDAIKSFALNWLDRGERLLEA
ncbi:MULTISPECIES: hypothetical protein [unclassified Corynebacterium]|uniref:hypothetical protein n=1 Tax=unclassified Corynebacterium TaxID=2624378 RepID=UPI00114D3009|nr:MULTISPECIES: hypothetical protein [unclassified Corynebacterium]